MADDSQLVNVIAWIDLVLTRPDTTATSISARLGAPQHRPTGDWGCALELVGFGPPRTVIGGVDSMQALALAVQLIRTLLHALVNKGAHLSYPTDPNHGRLDGAAIDAMFGVLPVPA